MRQKPKITNRSDLREKGIAYIKTRRLESALLLPQQNGTATKKAPPELFFVATLAALRDDIPIDERTARSASFVAEKALIL